jgi:hypothetical protein
VPRVNGTRQTAAPAHHCARTRSIFVVQKFDNSASDRWIPARKIFWHAKKLNDSSLTRPYSEELLTCPKQWRAVPNSGQSLHRLELQRTRPRRTSIDARRPSSDCEFPTPLVIIMSPASAGNSCRVPGPTCHRRCLSWGPAFLPRENSSGTLKLSKISEFPGHNSRQTARIQATIR